MYALALRDRDREEEARNLNAVDHGTEEEPPVAPVPGNGGGTEIPRTPPINAPRTERRPPPVEGLTKGYDERWMLTGLHCFGT